MLNSIDKKRLTYESENDKIMKIKRGREQNETTKSKKTSKSFCELFLLLLHELESHLKRLVALFAFVKEPLIMITISEGFLQCKLVGSFFIFTCRQKIKNKK